MKVFDYKSFNNKEFKVTVFSCSQMVRFITLSVKLFLCSVAVVLLICNSGCSNSISLGIKTFTIANDEGDELIFYLGAKEESLSNKLLVMIQGSGSESIKKRFGWGIEAATLGYDILYLEKYAFNDSLLFIKSDCRERRLNDIQFVINYVKNNIYKDKLEEIFLFADSEGGAHVPELAFRNPIIKRAIIIATGGFEQSRQFELLLEKEKRDNYKGFLTKSGITSREDLLNQFEIMRNNPSSDKYWLGNSYKYWNSYLWYNPAEIIETLKIPILMIIGERDRNVPVESVRDLHERFMHKTNLQIKIIPDLDHSFTDSNGDKQFGKILKQIVLPWYKSTL
ncbi:MAG: dienelactone hydrolase family protein [Ignavibacteriaceae bacterium]